MKAVRITNVLVCYDSFYKSILLHMHPFKGGDKKMYVHFSLIMMILFMSSDKIYATWVDAENHTESIAVLVFKFG
jgi:hypothetical protein